MPKLILAVVLLFSFNVFADAIMSSKTSTSFGIVFTAFKEGKCVTENSKSFLSWKNKPYFSPRGLAVPNSSLAWSYIDGIEIVNKKLNEDYFTIEIFGYSSSELVLAIKFNAHKNLVLDINSYAYLTRSKGNKIFVVTDSDYCLNEHVYKVENYSILTPWH